MVSKADKVAVFFEVTVQCSGHGHLCTCVIVGQIIPALEVESCESSGEGRGYKLVQECKWSEFSLKMGD